MIRKKYHLGEIVEFYDPNIPLGIGGNGEFFRIIDLKEGPNLKAELIIVHLLNDYLEIKILNTSYIKKLSSRRLTMVKALYGAF